MDYATLSLAGVRRALEDAASDAHAVFGGLDARQLNWRPDAARWSVGQCFDHLLAANRLMFQAARHALEDGPVSVWQQVPLLPRLYGRMLIRSQAPNAARRFTAPAGARPAASGIDPDVVRRFVEQQHEAAAWMDGLDERRAARAVMISPFIRIVTYSVLDGCRLVAAHDRRHLGQAARVMRCPGFPYGLTRAKEF